MRTPRSILARSCHPATSVGGIVLATLLVLSGCGSSNERDHLSESDSAAIIVFAAASTTDVIREAGKRFEQTTGTRVQFNFAASSTLAQQIKSGAPADIYLSASVEWMDDLEQSGGLTAGSRFNLLGNQLVLVAPIGSEFEIDISPSVDVAAQLSGVRRIAMGDPAHVPAGRYARAALESLGWWTSWEPLIIPAVDVRAALRLVEIGEVDAGVVYSTDAAQSQRVAIVAAFPRETHEPIVYPAALCAGASPRAEAFLAFLQQDEMIEFFERSGFIVFTD